MERQITATGVNTW